MPIIGQSQLIRPEWYDRINQVSGIRGITNTDGGDPDIVIFTYTTPADTLTVLGGGSLSAVRVVNPTTLKRIELVFNLNSTTLITSTIFHAFFALDVIGTVGSANSIPFYGGILLQAGDVLRAITKNGDVGGTITVSAAILINEFAV